MFFTVYRSLSFCLKEFLVCFFVWHWLFSLFRRCLFHALSFSLSSHLFCRMPMKPKASKSPTPPDLVNAPRWENMFITPDAESTFDEVCSHIKVVYCCSVKRSPDILTLFSLLIQLVWESFSSSPKTYIDSLSGSCTPMYCPTVPKGEETVLWYMLNVPVELLWTCLTFQTKLILFFSMLVPSLSSFLKQN